jgi:hypothetical protein
MKNKPIAILILTIVIVSCQHESNTIAPTGSVTADESLAVSRVAAAAYSFCGLAANIYNPDNGMYTLGMSLRAGYQNFGVVGLGHLDFVHVDKIQFEFSGRYHDRPQTVKLYRIRRSDGKYLSWKIGGLMYDKLITGGFDATQLYVLSNLGNNKFNIILPNVAGNCLMMRTSSTATGFKVEGMSVDTPFPGNSVIHVHPVNPAPPFGY